MEQWNARQNQLQEDGLQNKEIANISVDKRRNKDLDSLKAFGGPFTNASEVDTYLERTDLEEVSKVSRLYIEVRYAQDTTLSIPKTSDIFRLLKDYKKLPLMAYANHLKLYLNNITSKADVSKDDFNAAMDALIKH